ncbi:MAG TPA: HD domain-containing protein [Thermodesulfovibrionia bacterium]|nr:HD domain-containing protein [Thermodesulfovibrionia bacterium]
MNQKDLDYFKRWFIQFYNSFALSANSDDKKNYELKELHTYEVCKLIVHIGHELGLDDRDMLIAETIGLFHDIGRFPQYCRYKTFRDNISINHGSLGASLLENNGVLNSLSREEQTWIIESVRFHNSFQIPYLEDPRAVFFLKLIRDADKLDIYRVVFEQYALPEEKRASAIGDGLLTDTSEITDEIIDTLLKGQIPSYTRLKTINDYKLMQLSWVYDFNFTATVREFVKKDYLSKCWLHLPADNPKVRQAFEYITTFIHSTIMRFF